MILTEAQRQALQDLVLVDQAIRIVGREVTALLPLGTSFRPTEAQVNRAAVLNDTETKLEQVKAQALEKVLEEF